MRSAGVPALRDVEPDSGDLAVVEMDDGTVDFKRLYCQGKTCVLMPLNTAHDPRQVRLSDIRRAHKYYGMIA